MSDQFPPRTDEDWLNLLETTADVSRRLAESERVRRQLAEALDGEMRAWHNVSDHRHALKTCPDATCTRLREHLAASDALDKEEA